MGDRANEDRKGREVTTSESDDSDLTVFRQRLVNFDVMSHS